MKGGRTKEKIAGGAGLRDGRVRPAAGMLRDVPSFVSVYFVSSL